MIKLGSIEIEYESEKDIHYTVDYIEKKRFREAKNKRLHVVHSKFHSILHHTIDGEGLSEVLSYDLQGIIHSKLVLMKEQSLTKYNFPND